MLSTHPCNSIDHPAEFLHHGSMPEEQQLITDRVNNALEQPQLLLWRYAQPAIIMGCSQRPTPEQQQRAAQQHLPIIRRGSGGGAVLAGPWMLSLSVFIPTDHPLAQLDLIKIFSWYEQIWLRALQSAGVDCKGVDKALIEHSKQVAKDQQVDWACYAALSHGEIVSPDGRKLVGLAQIRKRHCIALVSGLHLQPCDWPILSEVVVDDPTKGSVLASLNADVEQLSNACAEQRLEAILQHFCQTLPSETELLQWHRSNGD
ncbi:lipoate--protein ligase family protein [Motiliproteus sp.]|uniref:lipoate--protein ligase family protein n=1 Tax=Motiliproteus sp. TaxID=1898955 RepID=UPI003BABD9DB